MEEIKLPLWWRIGQKIAPFTVTGSYIGLRMIIDREFLPWLGERWIPWFGVPLLLIMFISLPFAGGLIWGKIMQISKQLKNLEDKE